MGVSVERSAGAWLDLSAYIHDKPFEPVGLIDYPAFIRGCRGTALPFGRADGER